LKKQRQQQQQENKDKDKNENEETGAAPAWAAFERRGQENSGGTEGEGDERAGKASQEEAEIYQDKIW
jgi:hypothetical protein